MCVMYNMSGMQLLCCKQSCTLQNALHMCTHTPPPPPPPSLYTLSIKDVGQDPENDAGAQCHV